MTTLTFLQVNDLHGYVAPHPEMVRDEHGQWQFVELGGLARIAGLFDAVRAERPEGVIALDNGDTFHGTHLAVTTKGKALIPMMNALKLDAMTVHWEFAFGPEGVLEIGRELDYPILGTNCFRKADDSLFLIPFTMIERSGIKVAIIGLACPIVDKTMPASFSTGVYFTIGNEDLAKWIDHARKQEQADLVVVLSHLGFPQDVKLAGEIDGIDILVSGHTHNRMKEPIVVNGAIIFQSGCHGSFIGRLDVTLQNGRISEHCHRLVPVDDAVPENAEVRSLVDEALAKQGKAMREVVGTATAPLHRYAMLSAPMDDVLLEAIAKAAGTRIAFSNGWRYGAPIATGPVTVDELWNIIPTNPPVSIVDLTGEEIVDMLEDNLESTFAADPYEQMGGFVKRMRGVLMYFKAENPAGHRIDRLFVDGEPVERDRTYTVAFVTEQGVPKKYGKNRRELDIAAVDALKNLFTSRGAVSPCTKPSVIAV